MSVGILTGCDEEQEWMLPWWWANYEKSNSCYPVAFVNFGMSQAACKWCEQRGILLSSKDLLASASSNPVSDKAAWELSWKEKGEKANFWKHRRVWFKKPLAMTCSPFYRTLWVDIDCQILKNLEPLMKLELASSKLRVREGDGLIQATICGKNHTFTHYNSGVILFEKDSQIIKAWHDCILENMHQNHRGDDDFLSHLIDYLKLPNITFSSFYNWFILQDGPNSDAFIYHFLGREGKNIIRLNNLYEKNPHSLIN